MNRTGRQSALRGEPLRALMELAPGRGVKAVLALLLSAAFLLFVRSAFSETGSEWGIALISAACAAVLRTFAASSRAMASTWDCGSNDPSPWTASACGTCGLVESSLSSPCRSLLRKWLATRAPFSTKRY